jgi:hypothetical protein
MRKALRSFPPVGGAGPRPGSGRRPGGRRRRGEAARPDSDRPPWAPGRVRASLRRCRGDPFRRGLPAASRRASDLLHRGLGAFGIATDDCHYPGSDSRFAWTSVRVEESSREAVLAALREGRFYASAGPEILGLEVADEGVEVRCSPARSVAVRSGPWDGCRVNADPKALDWRGSVLARDDRGAVVAARFEPPGVLALGPGGGGGGRRRTGLVEPVPGRGGRRAGARGALTGVSQRERRGWDSNPLGRLTAGVYSSEALSPPLADGGGSSNSS